MCYPPVFIHIPLSDRTRIDWSGIPEVPFPPRVSLETGNQKWGGYFTHFEDVCLKKLLYEKQEGKWTGWQRLNAEFLLIGASSSGDIRIITDISGSFPCYFCYTPDGWMISTELTQIVAAHPSPQLNSVAALRFLQREITNSEETLVRDVYVAPAGCEITLLPNGRIMKNTYLKNLQLLPPFLTTDHFIDAFLDALRLSIEKRLKALPDGPIAADVTSGLDSSLLAYILKKEGFNVSFYSMITGQQDPDCRPAIVASFCKRHNLKHTFVAVEDCSPFLTELDIMWGKRVPAALSWSQFQRYFSRLRQEGRGCRISGEGADEIYYIRDFTETGSFDEAGFPLRLEGKFQRGLHKLITDRGYKALYEAGLAANRLNLPSLFPHSVIETRRDLFSILWENGIGMISPFIDINVLECAARIPVQINHKHEIWQSRTDIFVREQLQQKKGEPGNSLSSLLSKPEIAIQLLRESRLSRLGFVRGREIAEEILRGDIEAYIQTEAGMFLWQLLTLEHFATQLCEDSKAEYLFARL